MVAGQDEDEEDEDFDLVAAREADDSEPDSGDDDDYGGKKKGKKGKVCSVVAERRCLWPPGMLLCEVHDLILGSLLSLLTHLLCAPPCAIGRRCGRQTQGGWRGQGATRAKRVQSLHEGGGGEAQARDIR